MAGFEKEILDHVRQHPGCDRGTFDAISHRDLRKRRHKYITELESGPKTTRDMVLSLGVTGESVSRMLKNLREAKLVKSERVVGVHGNVWMHTLIPQRKP